MGEANFTRRDFMRDLLSAALIVPTLSVPHSKRIVTPDLQGNWGFVPPEVEGKTFDSVYALERLRDRQDREILRLTGQEEVTPDFMIYRGHVLVGDKWRDEKRIAYSCRGNIVAGIPRIDYEGVRVIGDESGYSSGAGVGSPTGRYRMECRNCGNNLYSA